VDNVTHTLTGLMLARCGMDRKVTRAAGLMMIAANLPDVDGISIFKPELYLQWHRGYTHALAFSPVVALIPPLLLLLFRKQRITFWAWLFSWIGVLSHLALDGTNLYGIRLLLPFSGKWLRLDIADLFDPWILGVLFLAVAAPALVGLVGAEIASSRRAHPGPKRAWAWLALVAMLGYDGFRYTAHERAIAEMKSHTYNGIIAQRFTAIPTGFGDFWRWKGIVEGPGFVTTLPVDLNEPFDPTAGRVDYAAAPGPAIEAARATQPFRVFADFSQLPFWKLTSTPDGTLVELIDLRFGSPQHPGFEASTTVDPMGGVHDPRVRFGR
jgi:inner membrane protein